MSQPTAATSFGTLLRRLRLASRLTQAALAERADLSERTIQELERGAVNPRRATVRRLVMALAPPPEIRVWLEAVTSTPRRSGGRTSDSWTLTTSLSPTEGSSATRAATEAYGDYGARWLRQRSTFIGRDREIADVARLLDASRLVTLTGPGGCGKTRLALEVVPQVISASAASPAFVALAPLADPSFVLLTVAYSLGIREAPGETVRQRLKRAIGDRPLLLVLDNFEHLLPAATDIAALLDACPRVSVLATSRELLRLQGEQVYPVPPLTLPAVSAGHVNDDVAFSSLCESEAMRLFADRARSVRPGFRFNPQNARTVAEICARLDGLPLAIELAAAHVRFLSPQTIAPRLEHPLTLLKGGPRDGPARQWTLRDTIAWSYDLLDDVEQTLFRRLAVFVGGFCLAGVQAVQSSSSINNHIADGDDAEAEREADLLYRLESLADKSLLQPATAHGQEPRFAMLETIREYGLEQLQASGEAADVRRRHADYYVTLAERAEPRLYGPELVVWLSRLDDERENLRSALAWSVSDEGGVKTGARLASALFQFWWRRGHLSEGREWLERLITREDEGDGAVRARLHNAAGQLARAQGDYVVAVSRLQECLAIYEALGDRLGVADTLGNLGNTLRYTGQYEQCRELLEQGLTLSRTMGEPRRESVTLTMLGELARDQGDYERASVLFEESLRLIRGSGDPWLISNRLMHLGVIACRRGFFERALALLTEALSIKRALDDPGDIAWMLALQGIVENRRREPDRARTLGAESLTIFRRLGVAWGIAECLELLAETELATHAFERMARLYGAAASLRARIGFTRPPSERVDYDLNIEEVRRHLGNLAFNKEWNFGYAMSMDDAVAYALAAPSGDPAKFL